ncbi:MAG: penicillin-insensitive murein endopeptidase [Polyangiaceae bacterium]|nr:penicillin-insensitive murein endopeptidase [Polyangiaceae bacterium]
MRASSSAASNGHPGCAADACAAGPNAALVLCGGLAAAGCIGCPTPLAPQLAGSIGAPHSGVLTNAVQLPVSGSGYARFRPRGRFYWGHPGLVQMIETVAASLAKQAPASPPLVVGDLSAREGGKIERHHSHRTGRDVDLLWFVTTPDGAPVRSPGFVHVGSDGLAPVPGTNEYVRLDVQREWSLFKALLLSDAGNVQWLFVSRDVEALIVDYAGSRGEDAELLWRAETTMLQPGDSSSHDDHVHLRIACSGEDAVHGCIGGGPRWEWLAPWPELGPLLPAWLEQVAHDDPFELAGLPLYSKAAAPDAAPDGRVPVHETRADNDRERRTHLDEGLLHGETSLAWGLDAAESVPPIGVVL